MLKRIPTRIIPVNLLEPPVYTSSVEFMITRQYLHAIPVLILHEVYVTSVNKKKNRMKKLPDSILIPLEGIEIEKHTEGLGPFETTYLLPTLFDDRDAYA